MPSKQYEQSQVLSQVTKWIEKVIIGLNFCPFAKKEMQRKTVRYSLSDTTQISDALSCLLDEIYLLDNTPDIQTTLLIFPCGFASFEQYLNLLELAESLIEQGGYSGIYQLASFHPDYCFADTEPTDPANFTNRAPFPILHILRESSIEAVLRQYPNPESIPEKNIIKARELGAQYLQQLLE